MQAQQPVDDLFRYACRLFAEGGPNTGPGVMATIIGPTFVLTADSAFDALSADGAPLLISPSSNPNQVTRVVTYWRDSEHGVAALNVETPIFEGPVPLSNEVPGEGARWHSGYQHPSGKMIQFGGTISWRKSPKTDTGAMLLDSISPPLGAPRYTSGAPVFVGDRIAGIVMGGIAGESADRLFATSLAALRHSTLAQVVPELMAIFADTTVHDAPTNAPPPDAEPDLEAVFGRLSPSSLTALRHAEGMRVAAKRGHIHMEHLIHGLLQKRNGPAARLFQLAKLDDAAWRALGKEAAKTELPADGGYEPSAQLSTMPSLSPHTRLAVVAAQAIATTKGSKLVRSRHLLYGALSVEKCDLVVRLVKAGVTRDRVELDDPPRQARTTAITGPPPIAGYTSDVVSGTDLLGLEREVAALSAIVAANDVEPPLAVGLFGEWGSGKSFFMGQMRQTIKGFERKAQAAQKEGRATRFCAHVVQLDFNAWHYMDTDLWASLASYIFDGLAKHVDAMEGERVTPSLARERLLARAASARDVLAEAEAKRAAAANELQESEKQLALAKSDAETDQRLGPKAIIYAAYQAVAKQPGVSERLSEAAERLHLSDAEKAGADLKAQLMELRGWSGYAKGLGLALAHKGTAASVLVAAAFFAGIYWLLPQLLGSNLPGAIAGLTAAATALGTMLGPPLLHVRRAMQIVEEVRTANQKFIDQKVAERTRNASALAAAYQEKLKDAEQRVHDAKSEFDRLQQQVEELRADRLLSKFLHERQASSIYTEHFGTIARARNDFDRLCQLFEDVRSEHSSSPAGDPLAQIDRIVLYIDDLDRCPEDKVVAVLQAVHLLLGLRLFVVVVGVDPRWLLHSLRQNSKVFRDTGGSNGGGDSDEDRFRWQSTPLNYLEKIFQIPFVLRPMESTGFESLIDDLVKPPKGASAPANHTPANHTPSAEAERVVASERTPQANAAAPSTPVQPAASQNVAPPPPAPSPRDTAGDAQRPPAPPAETAPDPDYLEIGATEKTFMKDVYPLIPSPRAAKRFVNVYRLLRATVDDQRRDALIDSGGEHRVVLLLLAMLTGYPGETTAIIDDLIDSGQDVPWWSFVESCRPPEMSGELSTLAEPLQWSTFMEKLALVRGKIPDLPTSKKFAEWAPAVARYSFQAGRLLQTAKRDRRQAEESAPITQLPAASLPALSRRASA